MGWQEIFSVAVSVTTLVGVVVAVILTWARKNTSQDIDIVEMKKDIEVNKVSCKKIEKTLSKMSENLMLLKENDVKHIEERMTGLELQITKVITIIKERLPNKDGNGLK